MKLETLRIRAMSILQRDIARMNIEVERGKLGAAAARDLVNYLRFITSEIADRKTRKAQEINEIGKLSNDELKQKAKDLLNE